MIRKATSKDIASILKITRACALNMSRQGIFQWNDTYPNAAAFENDVTRKELFVIEHHSAIVGCVTASTHMDDEYIPIKWLSPNGNNLYIHRLAVHPDFQGQGYAQRLMDHVEKLAVKKGHKSIRLDTFSQNPRNQKFYEKRGYKKLGVIYFPNQSEFPFYCYERLF